MQCYVPGTGHVTGNTPFKKHLNLEKAVIHETHEIHEQNQ